MDSPVVIACVNPDPDISGIGVRLSVYIQAFLNLITCVLFIKDGIISREESHFLLASSTNLFLTGMAILLSGYIQASTYGLSVYHATIILNLNWIVALSALLYLVMAAVNTKPPQGRTTKFWTPGASHSGTIIRSALYLPSVAHLCGLGAFGIWLWSKLGTFGQKECTKGQFVTVLWHSFRVTNPGLRLFSIIIYTFIAIPFINIVIICLIGLGIAHLLAPIGTFIARSKVRHSSAFETVVGIIILIFLEVVFISNTEMTIKHTKGVRYLKDGESKWTFGQTLAVVMIILPFIETSKALVRSWKESGRGSISHKDESQISSSEGLTTEGKRAERSSANKDIESAIA